MKKGFIKISNILYVNDWVNIHVFMKDFRPTHIEFRHWENDTWYLYGVSEMFDELKEGESVPQYEVLFMWQSGAIEYKFERTE